MKFAHHRLRSSWAAVGRCVLGLALVSGAASAAHAQSADSARWQNVVASAKKEGQVVLYSIMPPQLSDRVIAAFRKAYPEISVEVSRGPTGQLIARMEQERAAGINGADVFISTERPWFIARSKEGRLLTPSGPGLTGWPSEHLLEGNVVIAGLEPYTIMYNKKLVATPPRSYVDLLRPEFKDKLGTVELAATATVEWYDWLEKTQGNDYLRRLRAQNPKLYASVQPMAQAVASGEIAAAAYGNVSSVKALAAQGAAIEYLVPNPGRGYQYVMGALSWSKRPNAALVFVDFILSKEGQTIWHGSGEGASSRPDIAGSLSLKTITPMNADAYPPDVVKKYSEYWSKIFK